MLLHPRRAARRGPFFQIDCLASLDYLAPPPTLPHPAARSYLLAAMASWRHGSSSGSWWESSNYGDNDGDAGGGGDWGGGVRSDSPYGRPCGYAPPGPPPSYTEFQDGWRKGWHKGYGKGWSDGHIEGHTVGYVAATRVSYQDGFECGLATAKAKRNDESDLSADGADGSAGGATKKKKKKTKKGEAWKDWHEKYTIFDEDGAEEPYYITRLGKNELSAYPQEIQLQLLEKAPSACSSSQDIEYDMGGGWIYKLRLFCEDEKKEWLEKLAGKSTESDGSPVGAQWNTEHQKNDPPGVFDKDVQFRPIFLIDPRKGTGKGTDSGR